MALHRKPWRTRSPHDPSLDHRVDIIDGEQPRRPDVPGQQIRIIDLEEDVIACGIDHPDAAERERMIACLLGVHGGLGL